MPAYQIFGASAQKPNIRQFGSHFDSRATGQHSFEETVPTGSVFMPSTSFEKGSLGQHHSLYETAGEISLHDQQRDPAVVQDSFLVQDSLATDNLVQDSIESSPIKKEKNPISLRNSYNPVNN